MTDALTVEQIESIARVAGFVGQDINVVVDIAVAESVTINPDEDDE